jgi:uncharacterized protein YraI
MIKLHAAAATAVAAAAISVGALAAPASAATPQHASAVVPNIYGTFNNSVTTNNVNIRSGPGTNYPSNGHAQKGQIIVDYCYKVGTNVSGDVFWDRVHDSATGVNGYISEYYLTNKSQTKPC